MVLMLVMVVVLVVSKKKASGKMLDAVSRFST
jgi:hypothetical protein